MKPPRPAYRIFKAMAATDTLTPMTALSLMSHTGFNRKTAAGAGLFREYKPCSSNLERAIFVPSKHLAYTPPSKVHSMADLGYSKDRGVSPVGVSEPFPLFSVGAIQRMREEVLSEDVLARYQYSSELAHCQLRGYAQELVSTPFVSGIPG